MSFSKIKLSIFSLLVCYVVILYTAFIFYPRWNQAKTEATLSWDVSGYYLYLPAIFIYGDIEHCAFKDSILAKYSPTPDFQQAFIHQQSGHYVMKYSAGQAITMLPYFTIAHIWAKSSSIYPADGFSFPYQVCIGVGMMLYALIGLFFLRKILLHYFSDTVTAIVLLLLVIGTNYLNYSAIDQAMTHNVLFTIYTLLIWCSIRYYNKTNLKIALFIGFLCGLATLIRPTDIISVLIPVLWGINSIQGFRERFMLITKNYKHFLISAVVFGLIVLIQPIYWKLVSGDWVVYSYQDQGFSWLSPHLKDYLFSYRCGWLRYCPMMLIPFIGVFFLYKPKVNFIPTLFLMFISLYIVSAWDVWDYGGTAGRAMVQYYPIFSIAFAGITQFVHTRKIAMGIFYPIILLFMYLNIWWIYNAHVGTVQVSEVSHEYYWEKVGRWTSNESDLKLLDNKFSFTGYPKCSEQIYLNTFDGDTSANATILNGNPKIQLTNDLQYSPKYIVNNNKLPKKWARVYAKFGCTVKEWDVWKQTQFSVNFYKNNENIQQNLIRVHRFLQNGEEKEIYLDAICPKEWDYMSIYFWNATNDKTLYIDDLKVVLFDE